MGGYGASEIGTGLAINFCMGKQPVRQPKMLSRLSKLNNLIRDVGLLFSQVYNADENGLFWHCVPKNTWAFKDEKRNSWRKIEQRKIYSCVALMEMAYIVCLSLW